MAAMRISKLQENSSSFKKINMLEDLVEPRERHPVPNHILDTKVFSKLSQNAVTKIQPSVVHFAGYKLNKVHQTKIKICNSSSERQNVHIIPPSTKYFTIQYTKPGRFVPGFTIDVTINFVPDEWRYYYDCIRIHCKGEENIIVPLHAFPVMDTSKFPRKLSFPKGSVKLGESCTKVLPLISSCPVDFEFQITVLQSHPSFRVEPMTGIVHGEGKTNIHVLFTPLEYITAHMSMQLVISQFNTKPFICDVTASCSPPNTMHLSKSVKDFDELYKQTNLFDPRCLSPVQIARRRQTSKRTTPKLTRVTTKEFEVDGYQFPNRVNTQHAVNSVLVQEKGKLRMKDLREVIQERSLQAEKEKDSGSSLMAVDSTRQMKQAAFERIVRRDVVEERANQLRWQVHLGQDPMTDEARALLMKRREVAIDAYHFTKRKDPRLEEELLRSATMQNFQRTWRKANRKPVSPPNFDLYKNNPWTVRHRALERFQQAARTILTRCRAQKKVVMLKKMVQKYKKGILIESAPTSSILMPFEVPAHERDSSSRQNKAENLLLNFTPSTVKPFTFPVYVPPDKKEDIAPDALGEVPVPKTEINVKRFVPFHDLVVPKYYEISGYQKHDVGEALRSYVSPGLARPLRTGAEDEIIKTTLPSHMLSEKATEESSIEETVKNDTETVTSEMKGSEDEVFGAEMSGLSLIPPPALFKNQKYHRLHIFNRAPGLVRYYLPLPQSEVDPDYHLCPMPRYTMLPGEQRLLDRQDVIKGMMSWKKFSSHGMSAISLTPTLLDVWLPRWSDSFSQAMIPSSTPEMLKNLPKEDEENLLDEEPNTVPPFPLLTADMIKSQFVTENEARSEIDARRSDETIKDDPVNTARLPNEILANVSSKKSLQAVLEKFVQDKFDKLGGQMRENLKGLDVTNDS